jgi:hypothetical protein
VKLVLMLGCLGVAAYMAVLAYKEAEPWVRHAVAAYGWVCGAGWVYSWGKA